MLASRRLTTLLVLLALSCGGDDGNGDGQSDAGTASDVTTDPGSGSGPTAGTMGSASSGSTSSSSLDGSTSDDDSSTTDTTGPVGTGGSFNWVVNEFGAHDYGHQLQIPAGFGEGEFTLQLWIKPDASFPVGPTDGEGQLMNWSDADIEPYDNGAWWYAGNFLLDGHNNITGFDQGTFSLQWYGGGRVRWLFGDGGVITGGVWSAGAWPATETPSLLDDAWHQLTMVRRWSGASEADLELWIDGVLVGSETSPERTDMRQWWDGWEGFGGAQDGWFWGAEKQAAVGKLNAYEDYKGLMAELRFWDYAMDGAQISGTWSDAITGDEAGLVGWYPWNEGSGTSACDVLDPGSCIDLYMTSDAQWVDEGPPLD